MEPAPGKLSMDPGSLEVRVLNVPGIINHVSTQVTFLAERHLRLDPDFGRFLGVVVPGHQSL